MVLEESLAGLPENKKSGSPIKLSLKFLWRQNDKRRLSYFRYIMRRVMDKVPSVEDWLLKMLELAKMEKSSALIGDKSLANFRTIWKPLLGFFVFVLVKNEKKMN